MTAVCDARENTDAPDGSAPDHATISSPLSRFHGASPPAPAWFRSALACEPQARFVPHEGADIEVLEWGAESRHPSLLLLHGSGASADWWRFLAPFLAQDRKVVALTWSGMGKSGWRPTYNFQSYADEAIHIARHIGLFEGDRKPILVGHSMGGMVGALCATRNHVRFLAAVLIDSNIIDYSPPPDWHVLEDEERIRSGVWPAYKVYPEIAEALARFRFLPPQLSENDFITDYIARANLRDAVDAHGNQGWTWRSDPKLRFLGQRRDYFASRLSHVSCPLALIRGGRSELISPSSFQATIALAPQDTVSFVVPDAGHHVIVDQPIALVAALAGLLSSWPHREPKR